MPFSFLTDCKPYGLNLQSPDANQDSNNCVIIENGKVPTRLDTPILEGISFQLNKTEFLLDVKGISRFHVVKGKAITYELYPDSSPEKALPFLTTSVMAALLLQRGIFLLQGSTCTINGKSILISGKNHAGCSALVAQLCIHEQASFLADEICAIQFDASGRPFVLPGPALLPVWSDTLKQLKIKSDELRAFRPGINKFLLNLTHSKISEALPLKHIFQLKSERYIEPVLKKEIKGMRKFEALWNCAYQIPWQEALDLKADFMKNACKMAQHITFTELQRKQGDWTLNELSSAIKEHIS